MELSDYNKIGKQISEVAEKVTRDLGLELVKVEFRKEKKGRVLRIIVDKPNGISLKDCELVSQDLGVLFQVQGWEDIIPGPYSLEVSSPGLERFLEEESDFYRNVGQQVKLSLRDNSGPVSQIVGTIKSVQNGRLTLEHSGREWEYFLSGIESARLIFDFRAALKAREEVGPGRGGRGRNRRKRGFTPE